MKTLTSKIRQREEEKLTTVTDSLRLPTASPSQKIRSVQGFGSTASKAI